MHGFVRPLLIALLACNLAYTATARDPAAPATPQPLGEKALARHAGLVAKAKQGGYDLVLIGDSITDWWPGRGKETWAKLQAYKPLNLGWAGQHTEHILWRITNGELDGVQPKLVTIMIGTNNFGHTTDTPAAVAKGVAKIVETVRSKLPEARIALFAIFPRGKAEDPIRQRITAANADIAKLAEGTKVTYFDLSAKFIAADGTIPKDLMPDLLHPAEKGYHLWFDTLEPLLHETLGKNPQ